MDGGRSSSLTLFGPCLVRTLLGSGMDWFVFDVFRIGGLIHMYILSCLTVWLIGLVRGSLIWFVACSVWFGLSAWRCSGKDVMTMLRDVQIGLSLSGRNPVKGANVRPMCKNHP